MLENKKEQNVQRRWGRGAFGGCGLAVAIFIVVTICSALAFPFWVTMGGGSYAESQFFLNFVIPPICGAVAALVAWIAGFVLFSKQRED